MAPNKNPCLAAALAVLLATTPAGAAAGGGIAASGSGKLAARAACGGSFGGGPAPITINRNVTIFKPVTITSKVNVYKPITINKSVIVNKLVTINTNINASKAVTINKPVTINKSINITKNIDNSKHIEINKNIDLSKNINIEKNVTINKSIVINKGDESAQANAFAFASAYAAAQANAQVISYGGSQYVTIVNRPGGNVGGELSVNAQAHCVEQQANVVKSIHAVCVDHAGREYPASHMIPETWIDASYAGEIARCIPGATVRAVVGDVVQSDQGLAGTFEHGETLSCAPGEALVHYRGGMLKCAKAKPVKDCTERENLRRWGAGDFFFSYRSRVCVIPAAEAAADGQDLSGMTLEGGVGSEDSGY